MIIKLNNGNYYPVISIDERPWGMRVWIWSINDAVEGRSFFYDFQLFDFYDDSYNVDKKYQPKLIQELGDF